MKTPASRQQDSLRPARSPSASASPPAAGPRTRPIPGARPSMPGSRPSPRASSPSELSTFRRSAATTAERPPASTSRSSTRSRRTSASNPRTSRPRMPMPSSPSPVATSTSRSEPSTQPRSASRRWTSPPPPYLDGMGIVSKTGATTVADLEKMNKVGTIDGYLWVEDLKKILGDSLVTYPSSVELKADFDAGRLDADVDAYGVQVLQFKGAAGVKVALRTRSRTHGSGQSTTPPRPPSRSPRATTASRKPSTPASLPSAKTAPSRSC